MNENPMKKDIVTENEAAEKVATAEKDAAKKEFAEKEVATASTSRCGSEQRASLACWSCDKMFTVDDQGYIPEHPCAKDFTEEAVPSALSG